MYVLVIDLLETTKTNRLQSRQLRTNLKIHSRNIQKDQKKHPVTNRRSRVNPWRYENPKPQKDYADEQAE